MDPKDLDRLLDEMRVSLRPRIERDVAEIEVLLRGFAAETDLEALRAAQRVAHKLCGVSGTLGFDGVSAASGDLEVAIDRQLTGANRSPPVALEPLLERLRVERDRALTVDPLNK